MQVTGTVDVENGLCPIRNVLAKITGKWQSLLIFCLEDGPMRFSEIKRMIDDISQRALTKNLRSLERDGLITRTVDAGSPVAVSYELTPRGIALSEVLRSLALWAEVNFDDIMQSRKSYDKRINTCA